MFDQCTGGGQPTSAERCIYVQDEHLHPCQSEETKLYTNLKPHEWYTTLDADTQTCEQAHRIFPNMHIKMHGQIIWPYFECTKAIEGLSLPGEWEWMYMWGSPERLVHQCFQDLARLEVEEDWPIAIAPPLHAASRHWAEICQTNARGRRLLLEWWSSSHNGHWSSIRSGVAEGIIITMSFREPK